MRAFGACRVLEHSALWLEDPNGTTGACQEAIVPRPISGTTVDGGAL